LRGLTRESRGCLSGRGEDFREHAMAEQVKLKPVPVADFYQGGGAFCSMEFDGDKGRIVDWKK
jgi:uronate dehydrogenase